MNENTRRAIIRAAEALCDHLEIGDHGPAYDVARSLMNLLDDPDDLREIKAYPAIIEDRCRRLSAQVQHLRNKDRERATG